MSQAENGRRLVRQSALTLGVSFAALLAIEFSLPQDAAFAAAMVLLGWFAVSGTAAVCLIVGACRTRRPTTATGQGHLSDVEADFRYRQAVEEQRRDVWRQHRDQVLTLDAERRRSREYLALPEVDRYQQWILWQLSTDPKAESLPYPPPAYPPPPPRALPSS